MQKEKAWISSKVLFTAISEQLAEGRQAAFTITGMSMWPFLCHGRDQVIVERTRKEEIKKGDILLYQIPGEHYIVHRVTCLKRELLQTTGDGNLDRDPPVPYTCVVGKVAKVIRKGKTIDCSGIWWRTLSKLWMILYPVRKPMFQVWGWVRR